jgi:hypothetical protein
MNNTRWVELGQGTGLLAAQAPTVNAKFTVESDSLVWGDVGAVNETDEQRERL